MAVNPFGDNPVDLNVNPFWDKPLDDIEEQEEDKSPGFFKGFCRYSIRCFKSAEGFVSIGAELVDLGLDTDTATGVEEF